MMAHGMEDSGNWRGLFAHYIAYTVLIHYSLLSFAKVVRYNIKYLRLKVTNR